MNKSKLRYPDKPRSKIEITRQYIDAYIAGELEEGKITKEQMEAWVEAVEEIYKVENKDSTIKKFNALRDKFVEQFMPTLMPPATTAPTDYYKALLNNKFQKTE